MTRQDWESVRVQLQTGLLGRQLTIWTANKVLSKIDELNVVESPIDTNKHEQTIGEIRAYKTLINQFTIFVEQAIKTSKEEEPHAQ